MSNEHSPALYHFMAAPYCKIPSRGRALPPPPHAVFGLNRHPAEDWGKINDMSRISLFRYVFTKPFVCVWVCVSSYVCLFGILPQQTGAFSLTNMWSWLPACIPPSPSDWVCEGVTSPCDCCRRRGNPRSRDAQRMMMTVQLCVRGSYIVRRRQRNKLTFWPAKGAAMQPHCSGWYVKCVPESLSTNTQGEANKRHTLRFF